MTDVEIGSIIVELEKMRVIGVSGQIASEQEITDALIGSALKVCVIFPVYTALLRVLVKGQSYIVKLVQDVIGLEKLLLTHRLGMARKIAAKIYIFSLVIHTSIRIDLLSYEATLYWKRF